MSSQSVNARRNIVVASLLVVLAIGSVGLTGCISSMVIPGIAVGRMASELAYDLTQDIITSSSLYGLAVRRAQESAEIVAALGYPLKAGEVRLPSEYSFERPGYGHADVSIRVYGPQGTGDLHVVADLRGAPAEEWVREEFRGIVVSLPEVAGDSWDLETLELTVDGSSMSIDLLGGAE